MSMAGQPGKNASDRAGLAGREPDPGVIVAHVATLADDEGWDGPGVDVEAMIEAADERRRAAEDKRNRR